MANKVSSTNEVYLNGNYFPIARPVQSVLASVYPAKVTIGDTTRDSQVRSSIIAWSDWRGGIGVERMEGAGETDRSWWSTCQLRYKNHLVLPGKDVQTAAASHSLSDTRIGAIAELGGEIYAAWNGTTSQNAKIFKYSNTGDSWGSALATPADQVTDVVNYTNRAGTSYIVFAHYDANGSGYTYTSNGSNWYSDSQDTQFLTVWDERLWGISYSGQLWYISAALATSDDANTEVLDAKLQLPDGYVTGLFVARDATGEPIIYASTKKGLWAHDAANSRFVETQLGLPFHPHAGKGSLKWRDSVYIPSGLTLYKYINGSNQAVVTITGPDKDDGLPSDKRGSILTMDATHNELIAGVDATEAPEITGPNSIAYQMPSGGGGHVRSSVISADTGFSSLLGYNELGWEVKWLAGKQGRGIDTIAVNSAYDEYRIWWGFDDRVYYLDTPANIINPSQISNFAYDTSGIHETPWFNAGQSEVDKLALNLKIEVQGTATDELDDANDYKRTVTVQYALDYDADTYYSFTDANGSSTSVISSDGVSTLSFRDGSNNPVGKDFRAIKFKLTLTRDAGSSTSDENQLKLKTPDVVSTTLEFRKKLEPKYGHQVQLDLNREYKGKTPKQLRAALVSAIESSTLVEFTFRDDDSAERNYYVDVVSATGVENTGYDERGYSTVSLMEP
jgi:hypothetical protein